MRGLIILWSCLAIAAAQEPRLLLVGGPQPLWPKIVAEFEQRHPQHKATWHFGTANRDEKPYDLLFAYHPLPEERDALNEVHVAQRLGFPVEYVSPAWTQPVNAPATLQAVPYLDEGGIENGVRLLSYLYSLARPGALKPDPPVTQPKTGIYHPASPEPFASFASYRAWWRTVRRDDVLEPKAVVAIPIFSTWVRSRDLAAADKLIAELEGAGYLPVAAYGYPVESLSPLLREEGRLQASAVIAMNATLPSAKDAATYESWGVPVLNGIVTRESAAQWLANPKGLPADRIHAHLSLPERAGLVAPTLAATTETGADGLKYTRPHTPGITALVERTSRLLALRNKPNKEKRVALIYYNNPPGKGNIGASYLQVFPSIRNILARLASESYTVRMPLPTESAIRTTLEANGRNLELWAQGERDRMVHNPSVVAWPIKEYRAYYDTLPQAFRDGVEAAWGSPEKSELMTAACAAPLAHARCLLLPMRRHGNIALAPQPLRTTFDKAADPGHELATPPPHQYIAFYLWLRYVWKADAFLHLGRHGTLEWLPGKQTALESEAAPVLLGGPIPNFNIYVMDGGGEAIQAKRRGAAALISHLTPTIWRAGGRDDIEKLHQSFHELVDRGDSLTPAVSAEYEKVTRAEIIRLGLDRQLKLNMTGSWKEMAPALHRFLHEIEDSPIPAGLPIFGKPPGEEQLREAIGAFLFAAFPAALHDDVEEHVPLWSGQLLRGEPADEKLASPGALPILRRTAAEVPAWLDHLRGSGQWELDGLARALSGKHIPSRLLGDPLRRPDALPTGGNLHAVDGTRIPTEAAWRVGQTMAKEMIARHQDTHQTVPKRVSVVLWYGETERHQGAMESMALSLMGVRPVWNSRGIVEDVELIPDAELRRPRIDVVFTVSGNYRDGFPDKLQWLDKAVQLAAAAPESEIARNTKRMEQELRQSGLGEEQARAQSGLRIFGAKPGAYGVGGVQNVVERAGGGDSPARIAAIYSANMGFGYGGGKWGEPVAAALQANLKHVDTVAFSRSSNLYGALDNDDTYQFLGGLRTTIAGLNQGRGPEVYMHNLRNAQGEKVTVLREWLAIELHSRQLNPKWIGQMKNSGYAGARQIAREIEHLYGFQKTAPDHLDPNVWQSVVDVYVKDKYKLGLTKFFQTGNPHARQTVLARLLEVDRTGIHKLGAEDRRLVLREYARSLVANGAACNAQICGNAALRKHVSQDVRTVAGEQMAKAVDKAMHMALSPVPPPENEPKPKPEQPKAEPRLDQVRTLGKFNVTWVKRAVVNWSLRTIPLKVWGGGSLLYLAIVLLRSRSRRNEPVSISYPPAR
ncbi:MAG TPA: cobaltochelatase subunit CobN [Bryobacteraceae bacterium]|nr:cobaltochelatase subunit CobN [Bryobacteraceae bacterium]